MGQYVLPALRYDYGALEPHVSGRIMELHHDKHHAAYVKGANAAIEQLHEARLKGDFTLLAALERALAFNLSGHVLHSLFWQNLSPRGGSLAEQVDRDFGSFDAFRRQLTQAAATIMGSGWAALVWEPVGGCLLTTQIYDHQSNLAQAGVPLMVLDAWEHAYYLQYRNNRASYVDAIWNIINWSDVADRFAHACHGHSHPSDAGR